MPRVAANRSTPRTAKAGRKPAAAPRGTKQHNRRPLPRPWRRRALVAGVVLVPTLALATGAAWYLHSNTAQAHWNLARTTMVDTSVTVGLAVGDVLATGRQETSLEALRHALAVDRGDPILLVDLPAARQAVEALPWVETARIERRLPGTLVVTLEERTPLALWQRQGAVSLIDADGVVLTNTGLDRFAHLPLVVGPDAPTHAPTLLASVAAVPEVGARVRAGTRVSERRWDLELDNGVVVKLPEDGVDEALARLARVEAEDGLIDRDIVSIDLRLPDRLVIQTSPVASELRLLPQGRT